MPFKKGQSGNPLGGPKREVSLLKWEVIDQYIDAATKRANAILEGTDPDFKQLKLPSQRVDAKLKAIGHILKLAPERHVGEQGGPVVVRWLSEKDA